MISRFCCRNIKYAASDTSTATKIMIIVANAFMSGLRPRRIREKIRIGNVLAPGPVTKLAITKSSSERVKANDVLIDPLQGLRDLF